MSRWVTHVRRQSVGYLALFVALGGSSYAAISIPRGSVGTAQLRNHSITPVKLGTGIAGTVRAWAIIGPSGTVIASAGKPQVTGGGIPGSYVIRWGVAIPNTCATVASVDQRGDTPTETVPIPGGTTAQVIAGYVSQVRTTGGPARAKVGGPVTSLSVFNQSGAPTALAFDVAVIC